ncbi:uncharacterized protein [Bos taurus]|uniref:uncharacterized protein n=1 Tax=Bos taurus TaxID=9913 RepID=UPI00023AD576|nr:uncharacterized protein LOC100848939 [Bos taurus]
MATTSSVRNFAGCPGLPAQPQGQTAVGSPEGKAQSSPGATQSLCPTSVARVSDPLFPLPAAGSGAPRAPSGLRKERRPDRWPCEGGEGEASFGQAPGPRTSDTATRWIPRARAAGTRRAPRLREQKGLAQDDLSLAPAPSTAAFCFPAARTISASPYLSLRTPVLGRGSLSVHVDRTVPDASFQAARHGNFGTPWAEPGRGISLSVILLNVMRRNSQVRGKLLPSSVQLLPAPPAGKVGVWQAVSLPEAVHQWGVELSLVHHQQ